MLVNKCPEPQEAASLPASSPAPLTDSLRAEGGGWGGPVVATQRIGPQGVTSHLPQLGALWWALGTSLRSPVLDSGTWSGGWEEREWLPFRQRWGPWFGGHIDR